VLPGRQKAAREAYSRAAMEAGHHLLTNPADGPAWMQLTLYGVKLGEQNDPLTHIKKAEALGANDDESQLCKVRILEVLGRRDDALATIKNCFERGAQTPKCPPPPICDRFNAIHATETSCIRTRAEWPRYPVGRRQWLN
jgi:hypothetical protein